MAKAEATAAVALGDKSARRLNTPEGVDLNLQIADAGQRASAFLIDGAIIVGALIGMTVLAFFGAAFFNAKAGGAIAIIIWLLCAFLLRNVYFVFFELSPRAATPGKRAMGIRVAARNGGRLRAESVFARNAMRELEVFIPVAVLFSQSGSGDVDSWMGLLGLVWCLVFVFLPLFNRDRLRAGDIIGGTWVVRAPRQKLAPDMADSAGEVLNRTAFTQAQLDAYGVKELHVLEDVLRTRDRRTMRAVADRIAQKIGWAQHPDEDDFTFLSAYYAGLRGRLEARLLMGRRRKDKHDV